MQVGRECGSDHERELGLQHVVSNNVLNAYSPDCYLLQSINPRLGLAFVFIVTALCDSIEPSGNLKISSKHSTFL